MLDCLAHSAVCRLGFVGLALSAGGCATASGGTVVSVVHPEASSRHYETAAYAGERPPPVGFQRGPVPDRVVRVLDETLSHEFHHRLGYREAPLQEADIVLLAGAGHRRPTVLVTAGGARSLGGIPDFETEYESAVEEGTLVFDAFERESGEHVWHGQIAGAASGPFQEDALRRGIQELFRTFPAAAGATSAE